MELCQSPIGAQGNPKRRQIKGRMASMELKIELNERIIKQLDTMAAVLIAIGDANHVWPCSVAEYRELFPYIDKRTLRYRFDALVERRYLQKSTGRNSHNQVVICYERI